MPNGAPRIRPINRQTNFIPVKRSFLRKLMFLLRRVKIAALFNSLEAIWHYIIRSLWDLMSLLDNNISHYRVDYDSVHQILYFPNKK